VFSYAPSTATPVAVQVNDSPGASGPATTFAPSPQSISAAATLSSVTVTSAEVR
jgi:hypothetical protein